MTDIAVPATDHPPSLPAHAAGAVLTFRELVDRHRERAALDGAPTLALLADVGADEPLLVTVDDAQWLDRATAEVLELVARRLTAVPLLLVIAVGEPAPDQTSVTDAPPALLRAARDVHSTDPRLARQTLLDATYAALVAGLPANATAMLDIVHTARSWAPETPAGVEDLLLAGFTTRLTVGYRAAAPFLRAAVTLLSTEPARERPPRLLALGCWAAGELLDGPALRTLTGRWAAAAGVADHHTREMSTADPAGVSGPAGLLRLAWRGDEAAARPAIADHLHGSTDRGAGFAVAAARHATAILELGLGRYAAALTATLAVYHDDPPHLGTHGLPDLVEAAVRCGNRSAARSALQRFTERALAAGTPLAAALLDRSRALLAGNAEAERLYRQAIDGLERAGDTPQLARARLLYGEWLRRQRRRRDAREQLRAARDLFDAAGFHAFAQRADGELLATGERASKRAGVADGQLTPQEMQVARLVAEGSSNREVAAQLFISPNTVEYHLQKVFRKVGVSSRTQLAVVLLDPAHHPTGDVAPRAGGFGDATGVRGFLR